MFWRIITEGAFNFLINFWKKNSFDQHILFIYYYCYLLFIYLFFILQSPDFGPVDQLTFLDLRIAPFPSNFLNPGKLPFRLRTAERGLTKSCSCAARKKKEKNNLIFVSYGSNFSTDQNIPIFSVKAAGTKLSSQFMLYKIRQI